MLHRPNIVVLFKLWFYTWSTSSLLSVVMSEDPYSVGIDDPEGPIRFDSYGFVADADSFRHPEKFLNVTWFAPY